MLFQNELYEKVSPWEDWLDSQEVIMLNDSNLIRLLTAVYTSGIAAIDLETTGLDPLRDEIALVQAAALHSKGESPEDLKAAVFVGRPTARLLKELTEIIENPDILKIFFNAKFELSFIRASAGRKILPKNVFDAMLASQLVTAGDFIPEAQLEEYLAQNNIKRIKFKQGGTKYFDAHGHEIRFEKDTQKQARPLYPTHSLQQVAHRYLEIWLDKSMQVSNWAQDLNTAQLKYAAKDALVLLPLYGILDKLIKLNKLEKTAKIEFDCIPAVIEIEMAGMPFDAGKAIVILQETLERQNLLFQELQQRVSNPNSSVQIQQYLNKFAGPSGIEINGEIFPVNSGDENLSRIFARLPEGHQLKNFIQCLQEYRSLKKKSDFLQKWLDLLHPRTKRLHTDLKQINPQGVGRFSAREPNLQQVGRDPEIRALFKAEPGKSLVIADYGAIEMRIAAQLSKDKTLIQAFKEGIDIHKFTASKLSNKSIDEISKEERQASKACFSADTEILTTKGWVRFDEYDGETPVAQFSLEGFDYNPPRSPGNRWIGSRKQKCLGVGKIEFVKPLAFRSFDNRELVHYADRNIDLLITPDHEVVWIDNNHRPRKLRADKINSGNVRYFITAGFYKQESFALNEAETRVLAMAVADGSFKRQKGSLSFGFSKPRKIDRCRALLKACGLEFKETVYSNGNYGKATHFVVSDKEFVSKLLRYVSEDKDLRVEAAFDLNPLWYLDEAKYWDGWFYRGKRGERVVFSTTRYQTADVMQVMAAIAGVPSVLRTSEDPRYMDYKVYTLSYLLLSSPHPLWRHGGKKKGKLFETVPGNHRAYCVQVPSGAIVVRRNGKVVICGNCNFGLIYGMAGKTLQLYAETGYGVKMAVEEAQQARESFFKTYPGIEKWHRKQMRLVSEKGFSDYWTYRFNQGFVKEKRPAVRTLSGRLRVWPVEKNASGTLKKAGAVTEAFNTPDQGTGADIIKLALALLYEELVAKNIGAAIIGCVHDEIILETLTNLAGFTQKALENTMIKTAQIFMKNVPVEVEAHTGISWAEK